jgi:hypothetical protein
MFSPRIRGDLVNDTPRGARMRKPVLFLICFFACLSLVFAIPDVHFPEPIPEQGQHGEFVTPADAIAVILSKRWNVRQPLAYELARRAAGSEHGLMVLSIMAVESDFRPDLIHGGNQYGLGQIHAVHLGRQEIKSARLAGRPTLPDACGIKSLSDLLDVENNFCATETIFGNLLSRRKHPDAALKDYVGSRGTAGKRYANKVLKVHAAFAEAVSRPGVAERNMTGALDGSRFFSGPP